MIAEERAYMAGIIDGEGSIVLNRNRGYEGAPTSITVSVASTSLDLMDWLVLKAGGAYTQRPEWTKEGSPTRLGTKPCYCWRVMGERAAILIRGVYPWLLIKHSAADLALEAWQAGYETMRRPKRRDLHIARAQESMAALGWTG